MEDNKKKLYDAMSAKYKMDMDYETFSKGLDDEEKRKKVYDAMSAKYDMSDDYESFSSQLGYGAKEEPVEEPVQDTQPVEEPKTSLTIENPVSYKPRSGQEKWSQAMQNAPKTVTKTARTEQEPVETNEEPQKAVEKTDIDLKTPGQGLLMNTAAKIFGRHIQAKATKKENEAKVEAYNEGIEAAKPTLESVNVGTEEVNRQAEALSREKDSIDAANKALSVEFLALEGDIKALQAKIDAGTATQEEVDAVNARLAKANEKRDLLSARIDAYNGELSAYNDNTALLNEKIEVLRKDEATASAFEMADLQKELDEVGKAMADLKANKKAYREEYRESAQNFDESVENGPARPSYGDRMDALEKKQDELMNKLANNAAYQSMLKDEQEKVGKFVESLGDISYKANIGFANAPGDTGVFASQRYLKAAEDLAKKTMEVYESPSKYTGEASKMDAFGLGVASRATDEDFWLMGLQTISDAPRIREVLEKYVNNADEEGNADLTPAEEKLLEAYFMYQNARGLRAHDVMGTYTAGQGAADSAMYAIEFALTAGLSGVNIGGKSLDGIVKAMQKRYIAKLMTKTPTTFIGKASKLAAREVGAWGIDQFVGNMGMTLARTVMLPNYYKNIAENATQLNAEGQLPTLADASKDAWIDTTTDMFFENSGEALQRFLGEAVNIPARAMGRNLATGGTARMFREFGKSSVVGGMSKAAFSGPFEIYEEWKSALFNQLTGRDPDALRDFNKMSNLMELTASFAPMTILQFAGGGVHSYQFNRNRNAAFAKAAQSENNINEYLRRLGVAEEAITAMNEAVRGRQLISDGNLSEQELEELVNEVNKGKSMDRAAQALASILAKREERGDATYESTMGALDGFLADRSDREKQEFVKRAINYLSDVHRVHAFDGLYLGKIDARKEELRQEINASVPGNIFYKGEQGNEVVETVTLNDGSEAFVISTSPNSNGELFAVVSGEDKVRTIREEDMVEGSTKVAGLDYYLDGLVRAERQSADAQHNEEKVQANIPAVQQQFVAGRKAQLPLGENGEMVEVRVSAVTPTHLGVEISGQRGNITLTWDEVSRMMTPQTTISEDANAGGMQDAAEAVATDDMKDRIHKAVADRVDAGYFGDEFVGGDVFVENVDTDNKGQAKVILTNGENRKEIWVDYNELLGTPAEAEVEAPVEESAPVAETAPVATQRELSVENADALLNDDPTAFAEAFAWNDRAEKLIGNRLRNLQNKLAELRKKNAKRIADAQEAYDKYKKAYDEADTVAGMDSAQQMMERAKAELDAANAGTAEMQSLEADIAKFQGAYDAFAEHRPLPTMESLLNDENGNPLSLADARAKMVDLLEAAKRRNDAKRVQYLTDAIARLDAAVKAHEVPSFEVKESKENFMTLRKLIAHMFVGANKAKIRIDDFIEEFGYDADLINRLRSIISVPLANGIKISLNKYLEERNSRTVKWTYPEGATTIAGVAERIAEMANREGVAVDDDMEIRSEIIEVLRGVQKFSDLRDILNDRSENERMAIQESNLLAQMFVEGLQELFGVNSIEEYEAIVEDLIKAQLLEEEARLAEEENVNFVENENNDTTGSITDVEGEAQQDESRGEDGLHRGSEGVQQGEQSADSGNEAAPAEGQGTPVGNADIEHGAAQSASAEQAEPVRVIPSEISALADRIWQALGRAINIVSYATDLPADIAENIIEARKRGEETYGFFNPKTRQAYIILESMDSVGRLLETVFHEVGTHKGLRAMLGDEGMNELCSKVFDTVMTDEERQEYLSYANVNGDNLRAAEEWIAERAYKLASDNKEKSRWERFVSAVMDILRKIGFDIPDTQNTLDEIGGMLRDAMAGFIEESQRLTGNNSADLAQIASERYDEIFGADGNEFMFSRKNGVRKTLLAIHNISSDKLKKALKLGGLANPSGAVIDTDRQSHNSYGEISFLLPKTMVDAKTGRNLGTWLADAYTASYPRVIKDYTNETAWRAMLLSIEDETMRERVRVAWLNYLDDPYIKDAMKWQFLYETGRNPEIVRHEDSFTREISDAVAELAGGSLMEALDDKEKATALLDLYMTTVEDDRKEAVRELMFTKEKESDVPFREANSFERNKRFRNQERDRVGFSTTLVRRFAEDVLRARRLSGQIDEYETTARASRFITENNLDKEMEAWLGRREDMLGVREKFFVKYTPSGNRVYWENTLDNVSRYMKSQGGSAVTGFAGMHRLVAKASPKVKTIAAIKKAQENLRDMDAHKDFYDMWQNAYRRLADALNIDSNNVFDDSGEYRLEEVINMADPRAYLLREYRKEVSDEWYQEFTELQYAIRNEFPAMYFETKFARPVYLNEFSGAIVPVDVDEEIRNAILASGIPVYEYSNGVEGSREAAVAKAAGDNDLYFSRKKSDDIFVSNAMAAVMGINTAKATPEQWIGMLTSKGGLKAGEDKWLGLSEWLKSSDKKTINKDEILTYIKNNQISVEETHYSDIEESDAFLSLKDQYSLEFNDMLRRKEEEQRDADEFIQEMEAKYGTEDWYDYIFGLYTDPREDDDVDIDDIRRDLQEAERLHVGRYGYYGENPFDSMSAMETFVDEYGDDFTLAFEDYRDEGILSVKDPVAAGALLGVEPIDDTRLSYVTGGLEDKREIALTVPTIEPYNQADTIHFGDAGEGRAVAWVRFGDTRFVMEHPAEDMEWVKVDGSNFVNGNDLYYPNGNRRSRNYIAFRKGLFVLYLDERPVRAFNTFEEAAEAYRESSLEPTRSKVLVIDEIQSKRHQDARENGYISQREEGAKAKFEAAINAVEDYKQSLLDKYNVDEMRLSQFITEEEDKHWGDLLAAANEASMYDHEKELLYNVPDAPFDKNWHELAMKRMIRLAAEEGYDKIAWTNGDMQAERYNIGGVVDSIYIGKFRKNGKYAVTIYDKNSMPINHPKDAEGYDGVDDLAEVFGKDLATRLVEGYEALPQDKKDVGDSFKVDGDGLKIGGEGMRGFYDEILPRFVNKYGKKWGVKVGDITLPRLQNKDGWHSIDVTPEMKADVMGGQLMFSRKKRSDAELESLVSEINAYASELEESGMQGELAWARLNERYPELANLITYGMVSESDEAPDGSTMFKVNKTDIEGTPVEDDLARSTIPADNSFVKRILNRIFTRHGEESRQNNDGGRHRKKRIAVSFDYARASALERDRSDIRMFEEALVASSAQYPNNEIGDGSRKAEEVVSSVLIDTAKKNGLYITEDQIKEFGYKADKHSAESDVYFNGTNENILTVFKVKDPFAKAALKNNNPFDAILEHIIHNLYFPETRYDFVGITDVNGDVRIVLSQDYIVADRDATDADVDNFLSEAFDKSSQPYTVEDENITVTDFYGDNSIVKGDDVYVIDPIIHFKKRAADIINDVANSDIRFSRRPVKSSEEIMAEAYDNATDSLKERIDEVGGVKNFLIENILYGTGNLVDLSWVNETLERLATEIARTDVYYDVEQLKYDLLKDRKAERGEDLYTKAMIADKTASQKELAEANRKHAKELEESMEEPVEFDAHDSYFPPERPSDDEFDYQSNYFDDFKRNSMELRSELVNADNGIDNGEYTHEDVKSAYDAMSWILECREHWMEYHGVKYGEISEADVVKLMEAGMSEDQDIAANWNAEDKFLFDLIYPIVKKLHLSFRITDNYKKNVGGTYSLDRNEITISDSVFNTSSLEEFSKVVLHEMIHAVTVYVLDGRWDKLTPRQSQACDDLRAVYNMIVNDPDFQHEYGIKDVREMIAELANPSFRDRLKKKNLWERIVDGIREIVMGLVDWDGPKFRKSNAYEITYRALTDILNEFDRGQYMEEMLTWNGRANDELMFSRRPATSEEKIENITNEQAIANYTNAAFSVRKRLKEILVDRYALVDELVKNIVAASGKVLGAGEHIVDIAKAASSMSAYEMKEFIKNTYKPMMDYIRDIVDRKILSMTDIETYVAMKNGLERQTVLAARDAMKMIESLRNRRIKAENERYAEESKHSIEGVEVEYRERIDKENEKYQNELLSSAGTLAAIDRRHANALQRIEDWKAQALAEARPQSEIDEEHEENLGDIEFNYTAEVSLVESADEEVRMRSEHYAKAREKDYGAVRSWFAKYLVDGVETDDISMKPGENFEQYNSRMRDSRFIPEEYEDLASAEAALQQRIDEYERVMGAERVEKLWKAIRKATDSTVELQLEHHLISAEQRDALIGENRMFQYYVPLRGFADETAEELYDIQSLDRSDNFTPPLVSAKGRSSKADSPFGYIGAMHSSAAVQGFKNDVAMSLYNIVANRPNQSLVTIADVYYINEGVDENGKTIWTLAEFVPDPDKTSEENMADRDEWVSRMDAMVEDGRAKADVRDIDLRNAAIDPRKLADSKSQVHVRRFGKDITMKLNGNPRAAQILNGDEAVTSSPDEMGHGIGRAIRFIAQCFTSWAVPFWFTNLERDLVFGLSQAYINGDAEYRRAYAKNLLKGFKVVPIFLSDDHKLSSTNAKMRKLGADFEEFAKYGGMTGQTVVWNAEKWNQEIEKWDKDARRNVVRQKAANILENVMEFGESIEQISRFAAYLTAKEMGKSTEEAIADAKNITLNFNQKGTQKPISFEETGELYYRDSDGYYHRLKDGGAAAQAYRYLLCAVSRYSWARFFYVFYNAAMQGLYKFYENVKKHPGKTATVLGTQVMLGFLSGMMNTALFGVAGGDGDDDDYLHTNTWRKHNRFMLRVGGKYPLFYQWSIPQEFVPYYGLGEDLAEVFRHNVSKGKVVTDFASALGDLLPVDIVTPVAKRDLTAVEMPTIIAPFVENARNENSFGSPVYYEAPRAKGTRDTQPGFAKATYSTWAFMTDLAKLQNRAFGGGEEDAAYWGDQNVSMNPAKWQNVIEGLGGTTASTFFDLFDTAYRIAKGGLKENLTFNINTAPVIDRLLYDASTRMRDPYTTEQYEKYVGAAKAMETDLKNYNYGEGDEKTDDVERLMKKKDFQYYLIYEGYKSLMDADEKEYRNADTQEDKMAAARLRDKTREEFIKECIALDYKRERGLLGKD